MRSSAIAAEFIARGKNVIFIGQISDLPWVKERIALLGFAQIHFDSKDFTPNPISDILILDSYEIDIDEGFINLKNWLHVIAIVDELTPNYNCTLRIHPGLDASWVGESKIPILAGPNYIPIRSSISNKIQINNETTRNLRICVVAGGSDPYNLVNEIGRILAKFPEQFEVSLFSVSNLDSNFDSRFRYIEVGERLDEITMDVDLVITTASTSSLEFLARGICVGIVCAVENQRQYYESLGKLEVAAQLGFRTWDNNWRLEEQKIYSLITSNELRANLTSRAKGLIDFRGASRIVEAIANL
jgi:spore coat polysaccharide biosynthesis predicted glycosyltransferase SpsG